MFLSLIWGSNSEQVLIYKKWSVILLQLSFNHYHIPPVMYEH